GRRTKRADRGRLRHGMIGCGAGLVVGLLVAGFDLARWNRAYLSALQGDIERRAVLLVVVAAGAVAFVVFSNRDADAVAAARLRRETASKVAFGLVLLFGFGAWFVRPLVEKTHAGPKAVVGLVQ